ncbi:MAG: hypothetical protein FJ040_06075 [Chloroflexi bacterium]|nr:hypothetical protein [Chloroflexota bacterium]
MSVHITRWALIIALIFSINGSQVGAQSQRATVTASAVSSVIIDGIISRGEWPRTGALRFAQGNITVTRDALRLYMLVNVTGDTNSQTGATEYASVSFDVNKDGRITPNVDVRFTLLASGVMCKQTYTSASALSRCDTTNVEKSSGVSTFNCFVGDESRTVALPTYATKCTAHRAYEFAFDLVEIGAMSSVGTASAPRFAVEVSSLTPKFKVSLPAVINNSGEYTIANLANVRLPGIGAGTLSFPANPIEVTQAIQTVDNLVPLVAKKDTVVRVTVKSSAPTIPAVVYLSAKRGGVTLAGSPLSIIMTAKNSPNRHNLEDTANFLLPDAWTTAGTVTLRASVAKVAGSVLASTSTSVQFNTRDVPTYWVTPLNEGTAASPTVASDELISSNESYFETVYPVADVNFVRRTWSDLDVGEKNISDVITMGVEYYHAIGIAWLFTYLFVGSEPFKLPEMVYIFTTKPGGMSDPVWYGTGGGRVAAGNVGSSREGTLAHEFNHNLDRNVSGSETFGRHIEGCNSEAGDSAWPYSDRYINEVGFDTRLPWTTATSARRTVIPNNDTWPDYMTYCQSGSLPTKWVSPYRYTQQYALYAPGKARSDEMARVASKTPAFWMSGIINVDGSGNFNKVAFEPETFSPTITDTMTGTHSIKVLDSLGAELESYGFTPDFTAHEGITPTVKAFGFTIPNTTGAAKIELYNGSTLLESRTKSANSIVAAFSNLTRGQVINKKTAVNWTATDADTTDSTLWRYDIFYSPDGRKWYPLAMNLRTKTFVFDPNTVQAGTAAKLRLVANDGFNVTRVDSTVISVSGGPPVVTITQPANAGTYSSNDFIPLNGDARSISTDGLSENNVFWFAKKVGTNVTQLIGTSNQSQVKLTAGTYDITLVAKDANSKVNTKVVRIVVR